MKRLMIEMKALSRLVIALVVVLGLDGLTKVLAERTLELYQPVPLLGDFVRLTLGYNTGVAVGMFANGGLIPLLVTGIIITGLVVWFGRALYLGQFSHYAVWPIGLLLGGAIGNFIDRFLDKQVTDFIDVGIGAYRWLTFNLSDSFILIGVGLLMLFTFNRNSTPSPLENTPSESEINGLML